MKIILLIICLAFFFSCEKERPINPYFAEVYPQILEEIDIECIENSSEYYIYALINGEEFCHDEAVSGEFSFEVSNKFTTTSPNLNTGETPSNARQGLSLVLGDNNLHHNEHFTIYFPDFKIGENVYDHIDSLVKAKKHDVLGSEDIVITDDMDFIEAELLKANGGYLNKFLITLNSLDSVNESAAFTFKMSTIFGNQDGSYLRFNEVRKIEEPDGIYYFMDISFECNLYHWPQYGYEGLWGEILEGKIVVKVKVKE